jgi:hypothetical protein
LSSFLTYIYIYIYIYICLRRQNKLTKHSSLGTRRQTSTIEQVVRPKNYLDTRQ